MTSPDPVPPSPWPRAEIVTTEGRTWFATEVTAHALTVAGLGAAAVAADDFVTPTMTPPITPPTTSAAPSAAHGSHRRLFCPCLHPFTLAPYAAFHIAGGDRRPGRPLRSSPGCLATQSSTAAARPASHGEGEAKPGSRAAARDGRAAARDGRMRVARSGAGDAALCTCRVPRAAGGRGPG